jgi:enterochelin esterase-like enzyme
MAIPSLESPRITFLREELKNGHSEALEAFWREIEEKGAPLIEPAGEEGYSLLTFVWREREETHNVVIIGGPISVFEIKKGQMAHLEGTDLWYKTFEVRNDLRNVYQLSPNDALTPLEEEEDWQERSKTFQPDPLNTRVYTFQDDPEDPDLADYRASILELPGAPPQEWIEPGAGVARGDVRMERFKSAILENERRVWIYTPPDYSPEHEPYGLLLIFDGLASVELIPTPIILDNLYAAGLLPPMVAVIPDSLLNDVRMREMAYYEPFVDFLTQELLPWVHERYHVTADPTRTIISGSSLGGLAAAFAALRRPDIFGNVLSQSGAFWRGKDEEESEWLARQYALSPRVPVRFYLEAGLLERGGTVDLLASNRHMRNVLEAKGYEVHYSEFNGGHTYVCWRGSLAQGLLALMGKKNPE